MSKPPYVHDGTEPAFSGGVAGRLRSSRYRQRLVNCLQRCRLIFVLALLALVLVLQGIQLSTSAPGPPGVPLAVLAMLALLLAGIALWVTWRDFIAPLMHLRDWVLHMRGGNLAARMPVPPHGELAETAQDLNSLGEMLESLSRDTEQQLQEYTEHTAQKTHSLTVLYDIAASINVSRDLNDLLTRFLHTLTEIVDARAAAVRLLTEDDQMRMVASLGLSKEMVERERLLPAEYCLCGQSAGTEQLLTGNLLPCSKPVDQDCFEGADMAMLVVPLQYRGNTLGVYNLYVAAHALDEREDLKELLTSIGRHLGMAIDKARLDEEANRLSIMEERTRLAHELHDSLAQTLASLRFQVRVLDETMHQNNEAVVWAEMEKIENTVDEAHIELRELITHFRSPPDKGGLITSIERTVGRFRQESDIHLFLQKEWPEEVLPAETELQALRIVQEALANVRKHSQANTVRLMLRGDDQGNYRILIEDDGVGMGEQASGDAPGEHLGLSIMQDRAQRIGGRLTLESEPGEGVRLLLRFHCETSSPASIDANFPSDEHEPARTGH